MKNSIKCYCGHTTICDCGPEEPKQTDWKDSTKALMEAYGDNPEDFPYEEVETNLEKHLASVPEYKGERRSAFISRQETLEEAAEVYGWKIKINMFSNSVKANQLVESAKQDFIAGAKWQTERMYSEEEVIQLLIKFNQEITEVADVREWFEQFKKK